MTQDELINAYEEWLTETRWSLFGTLTFCTSPSSSKADRIFRQWIAEMKKEDGRPDFRWVRVTEHGISGDNLHYHFLAGGLRNGSKYPWILRWNELAGECLISYFLPYAGGIRYLLKTASPDRDFEIEIELPPITSSRKRMPAQRMRISS